MTGHTPDEELIDESISSLAYGDNPELEEAAAGSVIGRSMDRVQDMSVYDGEQYNYLNALRNPLTAEDLIDALDNSHLLQSSINALKDLVLTHISSDTLLANIQNKDIAFLNFDIAITQIEATTPNCDVNCREWFYILENIRAAYRVVVSRAWGIKRERIMQDMNRSEATITTGKAQQQTHSESKKNSLFKFGK